MVVTLAVYTASASIKEIFAMIFEPSSATCWRRKSAKRTASSGEQDNYTVEMAKEESGRGHSFLDGSRGDSWVSRHHSQVVNSHGGR